MTTLRTRVIKLAHEHPEFRGDLLPTLRVAMEFPTEEARKEYLKEHPGADPSLHTVKKTEEKEKPKEEAPAPKKFKSYGEAEKAEREAGENLVDEEENAKMIQVKIKYYQKGGGQYDQLQKAKKDLETSLNKIKGYKKDQEEAGKALNKFEEEGEEEEKGTKKEAALRSKVIHLAHAHPELRKDLLPILTSDK